MSSSTRTWMLYGRPVTCRLRTASLWYRRPTPRCAGSCSRSSRGRTVPAGCSCYVSGRESCGILRTLAFVGERASGPLPRRHDLPPRGHPGGRSGAEPSGARRRGIAALTDVLARLAGKDPDLSVQIASMREAREQWQREGNFTVLIPRRGPATRGRPNESARLALRRSRGQQLPWLDVEGGCNLGNPIERRAGRRLEHGEDLGTRYPAKSARAVRATPFRFAADRTLRATSVRNSRGSTAPTVGAVRNHGIRYPGLSRGPEARMGSNYWWAFVAAAVVGCGGVAEAPPTTASPTTGADYLRCTRGQLDACDPATRAAAEQQLERRKLVDAQTARLRCLQGVIDSCDPATRLVMEQQLRATEPNPSASGPAETLLSGGARSVRSNDTRDV